MPIGLLRVIKTLLMNVPGRQLWQLLKDLPFEGGVVSRMAMAIVGLGFLI